MNKLALEIIELGSRVSFELGKQNKPHRKSRYRRYPISVRLRMQVAERDNWTCRICLYPVSRTLTYPHPLSAEADHWPVPYRFGGPTVLANLRLAHRLCNQGWKKIPSSLKHLITPDQQTLIGQIIEGRTNGSLTRPLL